METQEGILERFSLVGKTGVEEHFVVKHVSPSDYPSVHAVINDWWGGRVVSVYLQKLFFIHFTRTSFVIKKAQTGEIVAFLIGFPSQNPGESYIHFIGVHPEYRKFGFASKLYHRFFDTMKRDFGCSKVWCITSTKNTNSQAFHKRMGFSFVEEGSHGRTEQGVPYFKDYDSVGDDKVKMERAL
jgi:ribosomal protein S18 acetylase RimI-like enzyme